MRSFFAIQNNIAFSGGFVGCLNWAKARLNINTSPVKIVMCRGGEKSGRVVAEITADGFRKIRAGRVIELRLVKSYGEESC